jgi:hypothetical protein
MEFFRLDIKCNFYFIIQFIFLSSNFVFYIVIIIYNFLF